MRISDWSSDVCSSDLFRNGGFLRDLYPLVPYRFTVRSAHDNSRGSGLLTCHRPIASRMLDVDEECCQIGRIGKTCDLAAHRTDQKALRLLGRRSEEHTSELQSLMRISYAVFCLKQKKTKATYQ